MYRTPITASGASLGAYVKIYISILVSVSVHSWAMFSIYLDP